MADWAVTFSRAINFENRISASLFEKWNILKYFKPKEEEVSILEQLFSIFT